MNHDPGPRTTQSASSTASTASGQAGGSGGHELHADDPAARGRHLDLAAHQRAARTRRRAGPAPRCRGASWPSAAPGPARPSSRPTQSRPSTGSPQQLPQRDDQQVADGVALQGAGRRRTGAGARRSTPAPLVVTAERGQRHPQVAGRQAAELLRAADRWSRRRRRR